ncbi:Salicylate hydroxylase [Colletotrichum higginsianum IMI 349063]|uniref:Salicylate hydroxylase n=3 Tax=Colletotrichum higginsianum TaxID=80884 RepID=A0A1B7YBI3_COLHI|nr:Salicylate hydroxylase [Colletotrichum higginsianum IMI 349063]OBR09399.1 Salicylate hydroxylase [Colletotrichum higginsianum IMI 349063]
MTPPAPRIVGICGAAIAGPTLALHLLSHPVLRTLFRPILFDQSPAPGPATTDGSSPRHHQRAGASVALLPNGIHPLLALGLGDAIRTHGHECDDLSLWSGPSSLDRSPDAPLTHLKTMTNGFWSHEMRMGAVYFERAALQALLVDRVRELGGDVRWAKKAVHFEHIDPAVASGEPRADDDDADACCTRVGFADGTHLDVDLLVGADGGYSAVRRRILTLRDPQTAARRWLPDHMGMTGIYGISSADKMPASHAPERPFSESHSVWLPRGFLATGPCPGNMFRWDLILPEEAAPEARADPADEETQAHHAKYGDGNRDGDGDEEPWHDAIAAGQYPRSATVAILRAHLRLRHPFAGDFATMLASADRIIHTPLRQRVWQRDEIQWAAPDTRGAGPVVLLGDAARLMLPTSGQGTGFAIEDATVLAAALLRHCGPSAVGRDPGDLRAALEEYAGLRVPRSEKMAAVASWVGSVGVGSTWYYRMIRYLAAKLASGADLKAKKAKDPWPMDGRFNVEETT